MDNALARAHCECGGRRIEPGLRKRAHAHPSRRSLIAAAGFIDRNGSAAEAKGASTGFAKPPAEDTVSGVDAGLPVAGPALVGRVHADAVCGGAEHERVRDL